MKHHQTLLLILCVLFFSACASVTYTPKNESTSYKPTSTVRVYQETPAIPYTVIGTVTAESEDYGTEGLIRKLRAKAMQIGADAIIIEQTYTNSSLEEASVPGNETMLLPVNYTRLDATAIRLNPTN